MSTQTMLIRWEKVPQRRGSGGPGVRWGHTCNAIRGGKLLYVFGGYGKDQSQTNLVHVFDTVNMLWSEPVIRGTPPIPRDSHSCTTVGDNLFVFGGTDGRRPLNDLHILDTSSNTWILPSVRGNGPEPREGHSAALIGKRLFIFGGCGKSENSEVYYDDLYILNTETFSWKRVIPSGTPPSKRDSHTCSSWKNKIIVIGGEDSCDYYLSDVHILDADTLVWCKLNTTGQLMPPRGGHTTIGFGKNLFVFGGFSDEQNLYNDVYMLDIENGAWTEVVTFGEGPSGRFSMAGETLDPQMRGVLVFIGGCNKNLEALDDMYLLHTGLSREIERDERRVEKLSLRKQLKLKCQEKCSVTPAYEKAPFGVEHDTTIYQPMPISSYMPSGRQNFFVNEYQSPLGKRTFQAKVSRSFPNGYTIETVIDGKPLRGVLFSNKPHSISVVSDTLNRKMEAMKNGAANVHGDLNSGVESEKSMKHNANDVRQAADLQKEKEPAEAEVKVSASEMKNPAAAEFSMPQEVPGASEPPMEPLHKQVPGASKPPVAPPNMQVPGASEPPKAPLNMQVPGASEPAMAPPHVQVPGASEPPVATPNMQLPGASEPPKSPLNMQVPNGQVLGASESPAVALPNGQVLGASESPAVALPNGQFLGASESPAVAPLDGQVHGASEQPMAPDIGGGSNAANDPTSSDAEIHKENAVVMDQNAPLS